jgi:N-acetylmuramoyl-L-alanine amidase
MNTIAQLIISFFTKLTKFFSELKAEPLAEIKKEDDKEKTSPRLTKVVSKVTPRKEEIEEIDLPELLKVATKPSKGKPMETFKDTTIILDAGHGGMIDGKYQTNGKRSPEWSDGTQLFEGVNNREVIKLVTKELDTLGIKYVLTADTEKDVPLQTRCDIANEVEGDSVFISMHSNAGGGKGFESFSYARKGLSGKYNDIFYEEFPKVFPKERVRFNVNVKTPTAKTANFKVLRDTNMPAVLLEFFFMDTENDCRILMSPEGRQKIAEVIVNGIKRIIKKD